MERSLAPEDFFYSLAVASRCFNPRVSMHALRKGVREGRLEIYRVGKRAYVTRAALEKFVTTQPTARRKPTDAGHVRTETP